MSSVTTGVTNALATSSDTSVLGPAILVAGESGEAYDGLFARIRAVVEPADMLEEIWVRDVTDLAWEVSRLRRIKAHLPELGDGGVPGDDLVEGLLHGLVGLPGACRGLFRLRQERGAAGESGRQEKADEDPRVHGRTLYHCGVTRPVLAR